MEGGMPRRGGTASGQTGNVRTRSAALRDVAALAGVSTMTVSRTLNDPERVRPDTRARVLAAVERLDYRPNQAARQLVTGRSGVLGVVGVDTNLYGPAATLYAIERAARRSGYAVDVAGLGSPDPCSIAEGVRRLRTQQVDGVIVVVPHEAAADGVRELHPGLPLIAVDAGSGMPVPVVMADQTGGAARATGHLLGLGHETVWHISGPVDWMAAQGRIQGWRSALQSGGRLVPEVLSGDWSPQSGYRLGRHLAGDPHITAIFVANDQMAVGVLRALHEAGRRVPEDVSVVGFDDIPEAGYLWPSLTTVRQDFRDLGGQAFRLLLQRMEGGAVQSFKIIKTELVVRGSTGRAP
ncbi:LacI family DNA-binding transcriptional regulator [Sphaerisporangium sp. NBC_01403]|uniref:LacI family DNA-binding transcriptional regulator n=1 Tax=Sphaerisporangium sp. NBC_01403 TaxID=2903599 RepID=UPI003255D673